MAVVPTYNTQYAKYGMRVPVTSPTTSANITNFGVSRLSVTCGPTSTGAHPHYVIDAPEVGTRKSLVRVAGTTEACYVSTNSTTVTFAGSTNNTLTFDAALEAVTLVGYTTSSWLIESNTGGVTLSASTGP